MALTLNTPGVYIQEISKLPASVAQVETAIPAFIGYTKQARSTGSTTDNLANVPTRISSMLEFESMFGGPNAAITADTVTGALTVSSVVYKLYYSLQMYFANGGGPCYIVSAGVNFSTPAAADFTNALAALKLEDEPTLIVATDAVSLTTDALYYSVITAALQQCADLQDRFTIIDVRDKVSSSTITESLRNLVGVNNLKYGAAYYPNIQTTLSYPYSAVKFTGTGVLNNMIFSDAIASTAADVQMALSLVLSTVKQNLSALQITLPPSGAIAGIYANVDSSRGVWKAPANVSINNVSGPAVKINDEAQMSLNVDPDGKSVNAIRFFTGKGTLVWGARTLAGNDNEWRYVNVRRLFITAEESIKKATSFIVFEANDANTWIRVKTMIENYLTGLWRDGALAGATPEEAFFVNVGLGTTMTAQDILEGRLNIEVGMAAVRPAEFIVLSFSHKLQTS